MSKAGSGARKINQIINLVSVGVIMMGFLGCSATSKRHQLVVTMNWLGVKTANHLKFYDINNGYSHDPKMDFTLPSGADELIVTMNWLGVKTANHLKFHDINNGYGHDPKMDFTVNR